MKLAPAKPAPVVHDGWPTIVHVAPRQQIPVPAVYVKASALKTPATPYPKILLPKFWGPAAIGKPVPTRTPPVPDPAGAVAVTCPSSITTTHVAPALPKSTESRPAAPEKLRPLTVTLVPADPCGGLTPVTAGVRST